jgi:uncharacterized protein (DUF433 family)
MMATLGATHIHLDDQGRAWIDETNVKVIEVALDKIAHNSSPEEMHVQYPHLSLAQIHAALAYYYDHKAEFDAEIDRSLREYDEALAEQRRSPEHQRLMDRLRAVGGSP